MRRKSEPRDTRIHAPREHRARLAAPLPILLTMLHGGRELVAQCCHRAARAGVHPGMTVAHARALVPVDRIMVQPLDEARDRAALASLAQWAMRFSPSVMVDPFPDTSGLLIDITGCERLFRGENRLVHQLAGAMSRFGFTARIAVAPTFGCAWALSRFGLHERAIVPAGADLGDMLAPLPVAALRIDDATIAALGEVGIERIEHLLKLPRRSLPVRFGETLLQRLDQALGRVSEMIVPVRPAPPPRVERTFDGPVRQLEAIEWTVRELLALLAAELQRGESGVRLLSVAFTRVDAEPIAFDLTLSRPTREVKHLWSLLRPRVEKVNLGFGIECIALTAAQTARLPHRQQTQDVTASEDDAAAPQLAQLVDVLSNRLGVANVTRIALRETHIPEESFDHEPAAVPGRRRRAAASPGDQPSRLFDQPQPIEVMAMVPDGPPSWLRWNGREHRISTSAGPQRIGPRWWHVEDRHIGTQARRHAEEMNPTHDPDPSRLRASVPSCLPSATRDYFKVQLDTGRWLWVFRQLSVLSASNRASRWFVHGEWA